MADQQSTWVQMERLRREPERPSQASSLRETGFRDERLEGHFKQAVVHGLARWLTEAGVRQLEQTCLGWTGAAFLPELQREGESLTPSEFASRGRSLTVLARRCGMAKGVVKLLHQASQEESVDAWKLGEAASRLMPTEPRRVLLASALEAEKGSGPAKSVWREGPLDQLGLAYFALRQGEPAVAWIHAHRATEGIPRRCMPAALLVLAALSCGDQERLGSACDRLDRRAWPGDPEWRELLQYGNQLSGAFSFQRDGRNPWRAGWEQILQGFPRTRQWIGALSRDT